MPLASRARRGRRSREEVSAPENEAAPTTSTAAPPRGEVDALTAAVRRSRVDDAHREASEADSWEDMDDDPDAADEPFDEQDDGEVVPGSDDEDDEDAEYEKLQKDVAKEAEDGDEDGLGEGEGASGPGTVWRRDRGDALDDGQKLQFVNRAYDCFFQLRSEFPCLSFDIVRDGDGNGRTKYPLALSMVVGSQAASANQNQLYIIRVRNLLRTRHDQEEDDEDDEDLFGDADSEDDGDSNSDASEINDGEPLISFQTIRHHGAINRVRCNTQRPNMCATWSETGVVQVFDTQAELSIVAEFSNAMREQNVTAQALQRKGQPLKFSSSTKTHHRTEGYGLDWSPVADGAFASGDCDGRIFVWAPQQATWTAAASTPNSPGRFVEEIQWSPKEANVLIAARARGDVEVWDTRGMTKPKIQFQADNNDINVASWNPTVPYLLATGSESGLVHVWDLRYVKKNGADGKPTPSQTLTFHRGAPISSVEFSQHNESVLSVTSGDGQCTVWDLSVERDADEEREVLGDLFNRKDTTTLPDQLMFQHQGLNHPKEVHFHPQVPGLVVTGDFHGMNIFKPRNWRSLMK